MNNIKRHGKSTLFTPPPNAEQLSIWDVISETAFSDLIRSQVKNMKQYLRGAPTPDPLTNVERKWILYLPTDHAINNRDFVGSERERVLNHLTVAVKGSMRYPVMKTASRGKRIIVDVESATVESGIYPPARIISTIKCNNGEIRVIDSMLGLPTYLPPHLLLEQSTLREMLRLLGKGALHKNEWTIFVYPSKKFNVDTFQAHLVPGLYPTGEFGKTLVTLDNRTLYLEQDLDNAWKVNGQYIRQPDILAQWGIVHYLDDQLDLCYKMPTGPIGMDDQQSEAVRVGGGSGGDGVPLAIASDTVQNGASASLKHGNGWWMAMALMVAIIMA